MKQTYYIAESKTGRTVASFEECAKAANFQAQRGYQSLYHLDIENRCPGCGKSHWYIGRTSAECGFCGTALPLAMVASQPMRPRFTEHGKKQ